MHWQHCLYTVQTEWVPRYQPEIRVAKCHGYDGYIRVKLLAGWGKTLGEQTILHNEAFFGGDFTIYVRSILV